MTNQTMTHEQEQGAWQHLTKMIHEYIDDYHMEGDEGSYTPTRRERLIAEDVINGMLVDDDMVAAIRAALSRPAVPEKWRKMAESALAFVDGGCVKTSPVTAEAHITGLALLLLAASPAPALEWSKTLLDGKRVTFKQAEKAVAELGDGWRLPTRRELESLLDLTCCDPAVDVKKYPDTVSCAYWTSTPYAWIPDSARWVIDFGSGEVFGGPHGIGACVRAVRAGR